MMHCTWFVKNVMNDTETVITLTPTVWLFIILLYFIFIWIFISEILNQKVKIFFSNNNFQHHRSRTIIIFFGSHIHDADVNICWYHIHTYIHTYIHNYLFSRIVYSSFLVSVCSQYILFQNHISLITSSKPRVCWRSGWIRVFVCTGGYAHPRTHSHTHSLTHTHSHTHAHTHSLTHSLTHSHSYKLTHSLTHSLTISLSYARQ